MSDALRIGARSLHPFGVDDLRIDAADADDAGDEDDASWGRSKIGSFGGSASSCAYDESVELIKDLSGDGRRIICWRLCPKSSSKMIQKGLAFPGEWSGTEGVLTGLWPGRKPAPPA
jgi:hypothetical protein